MLNALFSSSRPAAVERRIVMRGANYSLAALVTLAPAMSLYCSHTGSESTNPLNTLAYTLYSANGFVNFMVYAYFSKYLRSNVSMDERDGNAAGPSLGDVGAGGRFSWHAHFRSRVSVEPITPFSYASSDHTIVVDSEEYMEPGMSLGNL